MTQLSAILARGLAASRPAVGAVPVGSIYYSTDTGALERNSGSVWESIAPAASVASLGDIGDVNAPAPADGQVLTWDATPGEWVAVAPTGGGATDIDDLTDVDTTTTPPADGDVLTWDATPGIWVPAAPAGGGGGLTIEEEDGTPTGTPTTLVFPNGTLAIVSGTATYDPHPGKTAYEAALAALSPTHSWRCQEISAGTLLDDAASNNFPMSLHDDYCLTNGPFPGSKAINFLTGYADINHHASLNPAVGGDMTLVCWVYTQSKGSFWFPMDKNGTWEWRISNDSTIPAMQFYGGGSSPAVGSTKFIHTGHWRMLAVTRSVNAAAHYLDGLPAGTGTFVGNDIGGGTNKMSIGTRADLFTKANFPIAYAAYWVGTALSAANVKALYDAAWA